MNKFNVVGNPPYKQGLHLKILEKMIDSHTERCLSFIQPANWLIYHKNTSQGRSYYKFREKISKHIVSLELVNGNFVFDVPTDLFFLPCVIVNYDKEHDNDGIINVKHIDGEWIEYDSIHKIYLQKDVATTLSIKKKVIDYILNNDTIYSSIHSHESIIKSNEKFTHFLRVAHVRGHVTNAELKLHKEDFFTLLPNKKSCLTDRDTLINELASTEEKGKYRCLRFESKEEAELAYEQLCSKFIRFCLSLTKTDQNINRENLELIPHIPVGMVLDDDTLKSVFNLTESEISYINEFIEDFYATN